MSRAAIQRLPERFQATGNVENQPRSGRSRCINRQDDHFFLLSAQRNRTVKSTILRQKLIRTASINISWKIICCSRLHDFLCFIQGALMRAQYPSSSCSYCSCCLTCFIAILACGINLLSCLAHTGIHTAVPAVGSPQALPVVCLRLSKLRHRCKTCSFVWFSWP